MGWAGFFFSLCLARVELDGVFALSFLESRPYQGVMEYPTEEKQTP